MIFYYLYTNVSTKSGSKEVNMKTELAILGLLIEGNLYGYEIKKKIIERLKDYVDIKFGSIYYALNKAVENEWVKQTGTERKGRNPERYVYEILPAGKKYFRKLLRQYFEQNLLHFETDIILMFIDMLEAEQKEKFIADRKKFIEDKLNEIKAKISTKTEKEGERSQIFLYTYLKYHLQAELDWLNSLMKITNTH